MSAARAMTPVAGTPRDLRAIAALVHDQAGIVLSDAKSTLVFSRLNAPFRRSGLTRFADYVALLHTDEVARREAIEALTTNHTGFFREPHHFAHFDEQVRPGLLAKAAAREPVRLWSAGSSSGEEAYSLILTLLGSDGGAEQVRAGDVAVLASDINRKVLKVATDALYPAAAAEAIPAALHRWIDRRDDRVAIGDVAKRLARFRLLNLLGPWPIRRQFDAIFCRNTMIYFDEPTKARLLARLVEVLTPGGYLYIGHSERVIGPATASLEPIGLTMYRRLAA